MQQFTHLHLHTQYSILDGAAFIPDLMKKAVDDSMEAMAITDHGNMFGVMHFIKEAEKNNIKPIIGCEVYVANTTISSKQKKEDRSGYHLILLAKNKQGYHNLSKMASIAYRDGFYYTPRIDKSILKQHSQGLIASTACLGGEIPRLLLKGEIKQAEQVVEEFLGMFGDDFYLELMRHGIEDQNLVNKALIEISRKYNVPYIATNDVHYTNKDDFESHHILVCMNTGKDSDDKDGMKYSGQEYFKTREEMSLLFEDLPEAISNTQEIVRKIENFSLNRNIILPVFPLPADFENDEFKYLKHLTYEGAARRYPEITDEIKERLEFELKSIQKSGYQGYFLIVQDFIAEARRMGVLVGPGRGSAAGSAVAYCLGITNLDPIRYNLLFERFLNPERVSMPDIDVDFDDYGRDDVIKYVVNKYGIDRVAQIITFNSMASRSAIRDVARVLKLPLQDSDRLAKLIPTNKPDIKSIKDAILKIPELKKEKENGDETTKKTLAFAEKLEGSIRSTGTHACGVIIGRDPLIEHIPLSTAKDSELMVTQYEGEHVEYNGMLKMDFLGLKTLTIIKDALINIKKSKNIDIDIDQIPLNDEAAFNIFRNGQTMGIFQFESEGMRTHLKNLRPTTIDDLIAMNALYRPGPMDQIPSYIARKHGLEKVAYPHQALENVLKSTYGILVYQEQIMQCAQIIGGFTLGRADILRKAMGKKDYKTMMKMKPEFIEGASLKNIDSEKAEKLFDLMETFANYGFNRSHAAVYSILAYQTAYLKAHYTAPFMAAVLAHKMNDMDDLNIYINECSRLSINVLGPDINESDFKFTVIDDNIIRFGLGAIKGVGEAAVEAIIEERNLNGRYDDIFIFTSRVNLRAVNRKTLESLAYAGAFDSFKDVHRAQYFFTEGNDDNTLIDKAIKYGQKLKEARNSTQISLFGESEIVSIQKPVPPETEPWPMTMVLLKEKEMTGYYISGHPLQEYEFEFKHFINTTLNNLDENLHLFKEKNFKIAGMVVEFAERYSKNGDTFGSFTIEDFKGSMRFSLFKEKYLRYKHLLLPGTKIFITGTVRQRKEQLALFVDLTEIILLSELREKILKKITINLQLSLLTTSLADKLVSLIEKNPGRTQISFLITESNENKSPVKLELFPDKMKINPSNEFLEGLSQINEINYLIN